MSREIILSVCEIFYSIQGESTYAGIPCIFIRLAECNLNCSYCDTKYSHEQGSPMSVQQILQTIMQYPAKLVEITGGEPLIQDNVIELMEALNQNGYEILLETNGSIYIGEVPSYVTRIIDVKTPGSGYGDSFMKWNLKCLADTDELKFVITSHYDYFFAKEFLNEHKLWNRIIIFSPVLAALPAETLAKWILADGLRVRLQLQLHKILRIQ